ncbi:MAG: YifB family Mg chelatase-like AAA ATPase [Planctomycetota bacterium]|jgi:magnesium chelatase family protein|nr:YifB family Mg chelatase-like AAA ATPase [Planctomycetota bacterium]
MLAKLASIAITGIDAVLVEVELDISFGVPLERLVGLPDKAVKEALDRVKSALRNSGYDYPNNRKITFSLAPAELRKEGSFYDLPLALAVLVASGQLEAEGLDRHLVLGELSLGGELRPVRGALAAAITARQLGLEGIVLPYANLAEAAAIKGIRAVGVKTLAEAAGYFAGGWTPPPPEPAPDAPDADNGALCFSDLRGQEMVKRAMLVAAAGSHHCLLMGPPGSGKTMAAQRLPGILPPLTLAESLDTTKIHSVAGETRPGQGLLRSRPFRAPHHNASMSGLIGGGTIPKPGEISLAHNGVLFLDETPEFPRQLLETLRQPLEDGRITISRAAGSGTFPARILLVLSMNLCPCGRRGDPRRACRCSPGQIAAYVGRISGPLLDRIDIHVEVPPVDRERLLEKRGGETSRQMAARVAAARKIQERRFPGRPTPVNAAMTPADLEEHCRLDREGESLVRSALNEYGLSARAFGRVIKVARTIADLEGSREIGVEHLMEAVQYRRGEAGG